MLSTTHKREKWYMNYNMCHFWTRVTAIKFHLEKSNAPGGPQHMILVMQGHVWAAIPSLQAMGQGAEGSTPRTIRVCMALFVLIYYTLYLSNTWLLERKVRGNLEMLTVRKGRNITSPYSKANGWLQWTPDNQPRDFHSQNYWSLQLLMPEC